MCDRPNNLLPSPLMEKASPIVVPSRPVIRFSIADPPGLNSNIMLLFGLLVLGYLLFAAARPMLETPQVWRFRLAAPS